MFSKCSFCESSGGWKSVTLVISGSEKAVFQCVTCGLLLAVQVGDMALWESGRNWKPQPVVTSGDTLDPKFWKTP